MLVHCRIHMLPLFADGPKPSEDELITQYQNYVASHDIARQAIALHQLGVIYLERACAKDPPTFKGFLQASILLNCAYSRCNYDKQQRMLIKKIELVRVEYLSKCAGIHPKPVERFYFEEYDEEIDETEPIFAPGNRYRGLLADARREASMFLTKIHPDFERTFVSTSEDFGEQHLAILTKLEKSAMTLATEMKHILKVIFKDCEEKLGKAPCQYTVVGVGDIAVNHMTPYSDAEYIILTSDDNPSHMKYFHHLCALVTLVITSLGETPLTHAGIDLHQDFYNKHISQFTDTVTPSGMKINQHKRTVSMTPFCLHGFKEMESVAANGIDLIRLPKEMAKMVTLLQRKGLIHLALKFYQPCFIHGSHDVFKAYEDAIENHFSPVSLFDEDKPRELAQRLIINLKNRISADPTEDIHPLNSNIQLDDLMQEIESAKTLAYVLRLVYRCPLKPLHVFLGELKSKGELPDPEAGDNLRLLIGISYLLKLSHSLHQESHPEKANMLRGIQLTRDLGETMFGWNVDSLLMHFYMIHTPLWQRLETFARNSQELDLSSTDLHDKSPYISSKAFYRLNKFQQSIEYLKGLIASLKKSPPKDAQELWTIYTELGHVALLAKNVQLGKAFFTRAMESKEKIVDASQKFMSFVHTWHHFGLASFLNNDLDKAQTYFDESLAMVQENNASFLQTEAGKTFLYKIHIGLAKCKLSSALFKDSLGHYNQALKFFEHSDSRHKARLQRNLLVEIAQIQLLLTNHKECHATLRKLYSLNNSLEDEYCPSIHVAMALR